MKLILSLFCIFLLTIPTLAADEYMGRFTVDKVENVNGVHTWASSQTFTLNRSETKDYLGMASITYFDIDTTSSPFHVGIKTTGVSTSSFSMALNDIKNIKGSYTDNASAASIDDIRIKMIELTLKTVGTINSTSDNPIYAYFYTDREWALKKDDSVTFDAKAQKSTSDSGVSYSGTTNIKEVYVYFKRLQNIPVSISVTSENEPSRSWDNEKVKFTVDKSGTYVFTIKYDVTNPWGAATEVIEKYTFVVKGLGSVSSQTYSTTPYDVFVGDTKTISMTEPGTFSVMTGATATPVSNSTYNMVFASAGTYNLVYTTSRGAQIPVNFNIIQKPVSVIPAATIKANQVQGGGNPGLPVDTNILLGLGLVGLLAGIVYMRKNKGKGNAHYNTGQNLG